MRKAFLMILGLAIVGSHLLSQESAIRRRFTDQPKETEATPDGSASRSSIGLNHFNNRSNRAGLSNRLRVQSYDDLIPFWDATRNASLSDFGALEGKEAEMDRLRTRRLVSGLGLAVSWVGTVVGDLLYDDGYRQYTLVPVAGPWITLAKLGSNPGWPGAKPLLILSGVAQTGFAAYFIISLARRPKPRETKNIAIWTNFNSIHLRIQF